jgi:hypothetical protein
MVPAIGSRTNAKIVTARAAGLALTLAHNWTGPSPHLGYLGRHITLSDRVDQGERSRSRRYVLSEAALDRPVPRT